jgi:RND family efflux transporter MFP subunit
MCQKSPLRATGYPPHRYVSHPSGGSVLNSILFLFLGILLAVAGGCGGRSRAAGDAEAKNSELSDPVSVGVQPVELRTMSRVVVGLGTCEAPLNKTAALASAVEGRVAKILAKPGQTVKAGEPIVELDATVAEANFREKKITREGLEASLRLLKALPRDDERKLLELAIDDAKASVQKADSVVARLRPLLERKEISEQQMFEAKLALDQARVQQQKAEVTLKVAMLGARSEAVDEAAARITAAKAVEDSAQGQLDLLTIRSPIEGILDKITCRLGQSLTVGAQVGEVVDPRQLYALVWLPTPDARLVQAGQSARVSPDDSVAARMTAAADSDSFAGSVDFVGQAVDPQTGNVPVRVLVENPEKQLRLGQTVTVVITVLKRSDVLAVPIEAITDQAEGPLLSVVRDGKAVLKVPQIGDKDQGWVELTYADDIKPGELVVTEGNYGLPDDAPVIVKSGGAKP